MTSYLNSHRTTDITPEMLSGVQTGNGTPHDIYNIPRIAHARTNRKDNIFMQRRLVQNFTFILEWSKGLVHWWSTQGAGHNPIFFSLHAAYSALRHFLDSGHDYVLSNQHTNPTTTTRSVLSLCMRIFPQPQQKHASDCQKWDLVFAVIKKIFAKLSSSWLC